jgi:hypothetical protein
MASGEPTHVLRREHSRHPGTEGSADTVQGPPSEMIIAHVLGDRGCTPPKGAAASIAARGQVLQPWAAQTLMLTTQP